MKRYQLVLSLTLGTLTLISVLGADRTIQDLTDNRQGSVQGCRLLLEPASDIFKKEEPVRLIVKLKNGGKDRVYVLMGELMEVYRFEIYSPGGNKVILSKKGREKRESISTHLKVVPPGATITETIPALNQIYDMSLLGNYRIMVCRDVLFFDDDWNWMELVSNTVEVRIHGFSDFHEPAISRKSDDGLNSSNEAPLQLDEKGRIIVF